MNTGIAKTFVAGLALAVLAAQGCSVFFETPSTPLHAAAFRGDVDAIRTLVSQGTDVNTPDATGATALHWAARAGHRAGPHVCRESATGPVVITALLDLGANPNVADRRPRTPGGSSGWTPLFEALHHRQFRAAAVLLERGADPNIRSDQGMTVMQMASVEGAPRELLELLIAKGFDASR